MKKLIYLLTILFFFSCGSKNKSAQVFNEIQKDLENTNQASPKVISESLDSYFYDIHIPNDVPDGYDRDTWDRGILIQKKMNKAIQDIKLEKQDIEKILKTHQNYESWKNIRLSSKPFKLNELFIDINNIFTLSKKTLITTVES